jgi:hypothetical protein
MKKVLLLLTIAFLCSSCFSQAKRQSQAKTAKTQQSYPKRAPSYTSKGLITLPDAKFSDANLQTLYNKAARIYAQKEHDRHFNGHEANEMLFLFCSSVDDSQYNKDYEKVMDISPKNFASVVSPVFLQFLQLKGIQQPSTGKEWVKTINTSMKGITDPLDYLNGESSNQGYREYAADVAFMKRMQTLLCAYFSVSLIHDPGVVNKFWKMYSTSEELLSNMNEAIYSCYGGGTMMSEISSSVSESYVADWGNFIRCLARVIDKDPTLKTDPIVTKYLHKDMNRIAGQTTSIYENWYTSNADVRLESAKSDVDKTKSSLRQLISDADDFVNFSGDEQVYLNAYLMYFIDTYPRDVNKIVSEVYS